MLRFFKMNGAGNDFVMIDNRDLSVRLTNEQINRICDRHRGVGADGLIAVEPSQQGSDARMRYYNADGGEVEMCGNGARCFARFVNLLHQGKFERISFETPAGVLVAEFHGEAVRLAMSAPHSLSLGTILDVAEDSLTVDFLNTGVPHAVVEVADLEAIPLLKWGAALRHHEHFKPKGTNANFMKVLAPGRLSIRTYERGVEAETLACGTGMVACALIHAAKTGAPSPIAVTVRGGDTLSVGFQRDGAAFSDITLTGPAEFVFEGQMEL